MKKKFFLCVNILLIILCCIVSYSCRSSDPIDPHSGIVGLAYFQDKGSHAGIIVTIRHTSNIATTDVNGEFVFTGLDAGNYILDYTYEGYVTQSVQKDLYASATLNLSTITLVPISQ